MNRTIGPERTGTEAAGQSVLGAASRPRATTRAVLPRGWLPRAPSAGSALLRRRVEPPGDRGPVAATPIPMTTRGASAPSDDESSKKGRDTTWTSRKGFRRRPGKFPPVTDRRVSPGVATTRRSRVPRYDHAGQKVGPDDTSASLATPDERAALLSAARTKSADIARSGRNWGRSGQMNCAASGVTGCERVTGIEPALSAWEADVLPLNYTRSRPGVAAGPSEHCTARPLATPSLATDAPLSGVTDR